MPPPMRPPAPDYPDDTPPDEGDESFSVNVPMENVKGAEDAPDDGYVLVKYTKDGKGFCLDLESAMMPGEQPSMDEPDADDDLESALGKIVNKKEPADNEGGMAED